MASLGEKEKDVVNHRCRGGGGGFADAGGYSGMGVGLDVWTLRIDRRVLDMHRCRLRPVYQSTRIVSAQTDNRMSHQPHFQTPADRHDEFSPDPPTRSQPRSVAEVISTP